MSSVMWRWRIETRFDLILHNDSGPLGTLGRGNLTQAPHPASEVLLLYRANIFYCQECNNVGCVLCAQQFNISNVYNTLEIWRICRMENLSVTFPRSPAPTPDLLMTSHVLTPGCDNAVTSHLTTWSQSRPDHRWSRNVIT